MHTENNSFHACHKEVAGSEWYYIKPIHIYWGEILLFLLFNVDYARQIKKGFQQFFILFFLFFLWKLLIESFTECSQQTRLHKVEAYRNVSDFPTCKNSRIDSTTENPIFDKVQFYKAKCNFRDSHRSTKISQNHIGETERVLSGCDLVTRRVCVRRSLPCSISISTGWQS